MSSYTAGINMYYQKANIAKQFRRTIEANGAAKFEPKFDRNQENVKMTWKQIPKKTMLN